ncbi:MAG: metallophosphoesterase family protein [Coprobacillaceae bacterium]
MNEYDVINAYLLFLYNPTSTFLQRLFINYDTFLLINQWLVDKEISVPFFNELTKEKYTIYQKLHQTNPDEVEMMNDIQTIIQYKEEQYPKYHVLFIAGRGIDNVINKAFTDAEYCKQFEGDNIQILACEKILEKEDYSFYGVHSYFMDALYQVEQWPGILVMKETECIFYPINNLNEVTIIFDKIKKGIVFDKEVKKEDFSYFIQLSDLHLGTKNKMKGKIILEDNLDKLYQILPDASKLQFLITGDLMNSPNRKNMYEASSFMNMLKRKYRSDVTFILGNHDVIVHGFNMFKQQKAKVVAYLLGENIKVLENEKIIIIKMNSMVEGNLARGKVGNIQLREIDEELAGIENIEEYTLVAMLHHHVVEISKDAFLKTKWHENMFVGKIIENSKTLVDAQEVVSWLHAHHVQYVFHGHKHLPFFTKDKDMYVISGGSSCGGGVKESKSRYLNYNVLKYNRQKKSMEYCFVFYIDMTKQERQRIKVYFFEENNDENRR